jgi:endonuclease/exonuclease/phosphatase (EEP) superfamily protein YafD
MTANLLKGNLCAAEIVEMIEAESPDVVALQELKPGHIQAIERHLGEAYPYRDLHPGEDCEGIGLLSRYPFTSLELCEVAPGANPTQVARLLIEEHVTWVVNVHARIPRPRVWRVAGIPILHGYDTRERSEDIVGLARLVEGLPGDAILLGDHNTTPECQEYGLIPRRWHDAFREAGWGPGFTFPVKVNLLDLPMPFPLFRIDYVFYTGAWRATRARTGTMPGSDHRYVIVELV